MIEAHIDWEMKIWGAFLEYRNSIKVSDMLFWRMFGNHTSEVKLVLKTQIKESVRCTRF